MSLSPKENMLKVLRHETPEYTPYQLESIVSLFHKDALFYARNGVPDLANWTDAWGTKFTIPEKMNDDSGYPTFHPLTSLDDLKSFNWPDPDNDAIFKDIAKVAASIDRKEHLLMGMNPAVLFVRSWLLYGMENLLLGTIKEKEKVKALLEIITDYQIKIAKRYIALGIDIAHMGDDVGTNQGLMIRPDTWRDLIKPNLKRIIDTYKAGGCYIYVHCCGNVMQILDDLMELGVDILNPLQASANNLGEVRARTQGKIVLHGGFDCDSIMRKEIKEIETETLATLKILGKDAEYIAGTDQTLPFPKEKISAVEAVVRKHGKIPMQV
jgi:uroporphyrinogen decarboxylase